MHNRAQKQKQFLLCTHAAISMVGQTPLNQENQKWHYHQKSYPAS
jgi:hypothetical protein